jgi:ribulose-phosphate 3-epimerase
VKSIRARGLLAGAVLKVDTPLDVALRLLPELSMITLLGTAIGVKGKGLDEAGPARISTMRRMVAAAKAPHRQIVAADGGIRENTVPLLVSSGAQTVVMGSLAFGAPDLGQRMAWLHSLPGH